MTTYSALQQVRNLLDQAMDIMHETGDVESDLLDSVSSRLAKLDHLIANQTEFKPNN